MGKDLQEHDKTETWRKRRNMNTEMMLQSIPLTCKFASDLLSLFITI